MNLQGYCMKFLLLATLALSTLCAGCSDGEQASTPPHHSSAIVEGPSVWVLIAEHPNVVPGTNDPVCLDGQPYIKQWWIWPYSQEAQARAFAAQVTGESIGYKNVFFGTLSELWTMQPGPGPIPSPPADP